MGGGGASEEEASLAPPLARLRMMISFNFEKQNPKPREKNMPQQPHRKRMLPAFGLPVKLMHTLNRASYFPHCGTNISLKCVQFCYWSSAYYMEDSQRLKRSSYCDEIASKNLTISLTGALYSFHFYRLSEDGEDLTIISGKYELGTLLLAVQARFCERGSLSSSLDWERSISAI